MIKETQKRFPKENKAGLKPEVIPSTWSQIKGNSITVIKSKSTTQKILMLVSTKRERNHKFHWGEKTLFVITRDTASEMNLPRAVFDFKKAKASIPTRN